MNADTPLTQYYKGATSTSETWSSTPVTVSGNTVTLSWNAVEGGTYQISTSSDLNSNTWSDVVVTPNSNIATMNENVDTAGTPKKFYKVKRTGMTTYDNIGY